MCVGWDMIIASRLHWAATGLHLAQALVVCGLIVWLDTRNVKAGVFPLHKTVRVWHADSNATTTGMIEGVFIESVVVSAGALDVRYAIASFFALSAAFQGAAGFLHIIDATYFRFIEYAFSAPTMIMAIAVETGVDDIYTLQAMFVLVFATMVFGIIAELAVARELAWLPHMAGWVTFLSAYSPILDAFIQSSERSTLVAPGFVHVIVFLQFILFACFGAVQAYALFFYFPTQAAGPGEEEPLTEKAGDADDFYYNQEDPRHNTTRITMAYVLLSITAKSLLGWLILAPILTAA